MTDEFSGWLRKGLGRAAVFLKTHDNRPYRDALLHACIHNLTYDPQCEDGRAPYLLNLIELSGDTRFYRDGILAALESNNEEQDFGQLFELAASFAVKGDDEMKRAMYAAFERLGFGKAGLSAADELVRLDGVDALLLAAKTFGEEEVDDRPWQFRHLVETLEKRDGKRPLPAQLDRFIREVEDYDRKWEQKPQRPPEPDIEEAADAMLVESDKERLIGYLRMFGRRPFPRAIDRLLELARNEDDRIARAALVALENISDPRVRALGLDLMTGLKWRGFAVGLLVRNGEMGDYRTLERLLEETKDPEVYHHLGMDVRDFVKAYQSEEAERCLLHLYENEACSLCRRGIVKELIAINRFPDWMREECRYDADSRTRERCILAVPCPSAASESG